MRGKSKNKFLENYNILFIIYIMENRTKKCYMCKEIKDISKFGGYKQKNGVYKYSGRCSTCMHKTKRSKIHNRIYLNLKRRVRMDFKKNGYVKGRNFDEIFGMRPLQFKEYLESLFQNNMTWDNYGEWEIDHIIPLSHSTNQYEYELYSHHKNIRPYWKKDNSKKGAKLTDDSLMVLESISENMDPLI
jgi:hypothetical protein